MTHHHQSIPRNMRGAKWLLGATYLSAEDLDAIMATVAEAKRAFPEWAKSVGVRCPSYIGEPHPIATVTYGQGGCRIYRSVYRQPDPDLRTYANTATGDPA